ncbi:hypothetical protein HNR42_003054 [Deinobacterium chartae]|uniref:Lipoprotein n=1 Tax=Deinobacterium chartae TaxID=521158 RepID=A0A841I1B9_9DEIO|nr:hypothetical protein [Deinobacterium chartae]MBB6099601.1 hypothetical protein [Deinobacterium chartae]
MPRLLLLLSAVLFACASPPAWNPPPEARTESLKVRGWTGEDLELQLQLTYDEVAAQRLPARGHVHPDGTLELHLPGAERVAPHLQALPLLERAGCDGPLPALKAVWVGSFELATQTLPLGTVVSGEHDAQGRYIADALVYADRAWQLTTSRRCPGATYYLELNLERGWNRVHWIRQTLPDRTEQVEVGSGSHALAVWRFLDARERQAPPDGLSKM